MLFTSQCLYYFALPLLKTFMFLVLRTHFWIPAFKLNHSPSKNCPFASVWPAKQPYHCLAPFPLLPVSRVPVYTAGRGAVRREQWARAAGCSARRSDRQPESRSPHWPGRPGHRSAWQTQSGPRLEIAQGSHERGSLPPSAGIQSHTLTSLTLSYMLMQLKLLLYAREVKFQKKAGAHDDAPD